jgi:hypothetical protein
MAASIRDSDMSIFGRVSLAIFADKKFATSSFHPSNFVVSLVRIFVISSLVGVPSVFFCEESGLHDDMIIELSTGTIHFFMKVCQADKILLYLLYLFYIKSQVKTHLSVLFGLLHSDRRSMQHQESVATHFSHLRMVYDLHDA